MKDVSTLEETIQSAITHETPAVELAILSLGFVPQEGEEPLDLIVLNEMPCTRYQREAGVVEEDEAWLQQFIGVYTGSHTITRIGAALSPCLKTRDLRRALLVC